MPLIKDSPILPASSAEPLTAFDPEDQPLPRGATAAAKYAADVAAMREAFPNVILVKGLDALADYLHRHIWCREDICSIFPWGTTLFSWTAGSSIPFILNTKAVRAHYKDLMADWPLQTRNAKKLFDPEDLKEWFRKNLVSTVDSVLVPLTLFAENPDAMRKAFKEASAKHLPDAMAISARRGISRCRLALWPEIIELVRPQYRGEIGRFFDDLAEAAEEQQVARARAKLPRYRVMLPEDKMPKFFSIKDSASTRGNFSSQGVGASTVRFFAWARHEFTPEADALGSSRSHQKVAVTQGLWIGGEACIQDYEIGLVDLMSAKRFVSLFGLNALQKADWRFSNDLCAWAKPDAKFGPGFPPKTQAVLLGTNWVAPRER